MSFFKTSQDVNIYYEVHGKEPGKGKPALIMLHGLASATVIWAPQIEAFTQEFEVYLFDYPGHGKSDRKSPYTITTYAQVLQEFMDHLDIKKAHLMGLSLGCAVALTFGCWHPEQVLSLVLQGPVGGLKPPYHPQAWPLMMAIGVYLLTLSSLFALLGQRKAALIVNKIGMQTYGCYDLLVNVQSKVDPRAVILITIELSYPPYVGKLDQIKAPAIIIHGQDDPTPREYYQYICDHLGAPCEVKAIPNGRHVIALEKPDEFNQLALEFLKKPMIAL